MRPQPLFTVFLGLTLAACSSDLPQEAGATAASQLPLTVIPQTKLLKAAEPVGNQYIVVLHDGAKDVDAVAAQQALAAGGQVGLTFKHALLGYVLRADEAAALQLLDDPRVKYVEEDGLVNLDTTQSPATWGLDRLDQRLLPLDSNYTYNVNGAGVNAYIIDTGIRITHAEFDGRAAYGFSSIEDGNGANDCHGHGTHVAGTAGGSTYGVAKGVNLIAVRVLNCSGSGTYSGVIAGIDWVTANRVLPAVANMSLGGGASQALDDAVTASINSGVTYAVAAGNGGADACLFSPARTPAALTVAASTSVDARAYFSNYGTCVDLFAPGMGITSAWSSSDTATNTISGTSMASPHVAGSAALYLSTHPAATPAQVELVLEAQATVDAIADPGAGTPNLLAYTAFIGGGGDQTPPAASITAPANGAQVSGAVTIEASASDNVGIVRVVFYANGVMISSDTSAPYSTVWNTTGGWNGTYTLKARAFDSAGNVGDSAPVSVTLNNPGAAIYDPVLKAPRCGTPGAYCDSMSLVNGRGPLGPEVNAPNNIYSQCADGTVGSYHSDESLDRLRVTTLDGSTMAPGKQVRIDATVFAWVGYTSDRLDLYYAANAASPSWTYLGTVIPAKAGLQVLSKTYALPNGSLQAIRGTFRYGGGPTTCHAGPFSESDDLVFTVGPVQYPPSSSFTVSCYGLSCAFKDTSTDPDSTIVAWSWLFGDGSSSTEQHPPHVFAVDGTYTVSLKVTDSQGLSHTSSQPVSVEGLPPVASFTASCTYLSCSFTDTSTDEDSTITGWEWTFGDGYSTIVKSPVHAFGAAGTYTVTLKVTDSQGKTGTASQSITVADPPVIELAATGARIRGVLTVDLAWTGATGSLVDVYRNDILLLSTDNDGAHRDTVVDPRDRFGTYSYRVCLQESGVCSNIATVVF